MVTNTTFNEEECKTVEHIEKIERFCGIAKFKVCLDLVHNVYSTSSFDLVLEKIKKLYT